MTTGAPVAEAMTGRGEPRRPQAGPTRAASRGPWGLAGALVVAAVWSGGLAVGFPYEATDDALQHVRLARNLAAGRGFSAAEAEPFVPTMQREPLYPLMLSGVFRVAGDRPGVARAVQITCFLATVWLAYQLGQLLFGERVARWAALGTAAAPPLANYPSYLLSETLFTLLLTALCWALVMAAQHRTMRWFALAGLLWGLGTLCKGILLVTAPCFVAAGLATGAAGRSWREAMMRWSVFLVAGGLVIAPWLARNAARFGEPQLASLRGSKAVWERASRLSDRPRDTARRLAYSVSESLGARWWPPATGRSRDVLLAASAAANQRQAALAAAGLSEPAIDRAMLDEAAAAIRRHPVKYLLQSAPEMMQLTAILYVPVLNEPRVEAAAHRQPSRRAALTAVRAALRAAGWIVLALALAGVWAARSSLGASVFLLAPIVGLNAAYSLLSGLGRYGVPLVPLYMVWAAVGLAAWRSRRAAGATA